MCGVLRFGVVGVCRGDRVKLCSKGHRVRFGRAGRSFLPYSEVTLTEPQHPVISESKLDLDADLYLDAELRLRRYD